MDAKALKPMWEALVLRGVAGILFGIAAVFWPALTLVVLVYLFSVYILVSGVVGMVESVVHLTRSQTWFWKMLLGILELGVGVYLVRHPSVTFATFVLVAGLVLIARGVFEGIMALVDDYSATNKTLLLIGGVLSVLVGIVILLQPVEGGIAFVWILGVYALVTGPIWIALALDTKHAVEDVSVVGRRR
jgi:uncharacterized membrane protein HdeD (DUF308 family)